MIEVRRQPEQCQLSRQSPFDHGIGLAARAGEGVAGRAGAQAYGRRLAIPEQQLDWTV